MRIVLVGAGAMGGALLSGWVAGGQDPADVVVVDSYTPRVNELVAEFGVRGADLNEAAEADVVVLAVKPHQILGVAKALDGALRPGTVVVSIAAGVPLAKLVDALPEGQPVFRVMPNTPALLGKGMSGVVAGPGTSQDQQLMVVGLLDAVGRTVVIDEDHIDALTGLSGSGPAYLFYVAEAMVEAGVHQGLTRPEATALVNQTFVGAAAMLDESGDSATLLRERVTSPGGTTAAALRTLDDHGVRAALLAAVEACVERGAQMASDG
ncbi:pyrroline-5-carboxylate reductase [Tessaracoccus rhinocerotis]|uniref:Pyrroline-5-carboxylate reductase n=1 Tax=Tessaracoccus rhinocerotis TaxID=1689449 RepID=A0A553K1K8_9ACTN|nr:pyrroline-5-carboxylate reductase [Tessaracoccus rhinocerotis]TRY18584.1 pyrroline-5-carboxylate reductase [Tessaracoccus rhinocerotis]